MIDAANLRAGLAVEVDPRELIRDYLVQRVEHGLVRDRADVVAALKDAGLDVPRQGRDYVTARDPETGKRWRLKGALYEHDFEPERLGRPAAAEVGDRPGEIKETGVTELRRLGESLSSAARSAQRSIDADMAAWTDRIRALLMRAWLLPAAAGLSLFLVICGGSWVINDNYFCRSPTRRSGGRRGGREACDTARYAELRIAGTMRSAGLCGVG